MMDSTSPHTALSPEMLARYDRPGPRYTSYPTAPAWREDFGDADYRNALAEAAQRESDPMSLYVHIPFCRERCKFCGCNVIIGRKPGLAEQYITYLERELEMLAAALGNRRSINQLHWGGGTPTFLTVDEINRLYSAIASRFDILDGAEVAIEADPRVTTEDQVRALRANGFNRISLGVQDIDPFVQQAIGRDQSEDHTRTLVEISRRFGFEGLNIDLIYGLPGQSEASWAATLNKVADIRPDRLAVYSFAYLPEKLRNQNRIDSDLLPDADLKYRLLAATREAFLNVGYEAIGMDHFALPTDDLAVARREHRLNRNFMGYTVVAASDAVAIGASAISEVAGVYSQNEKKLSRYYAAIDNEEFPVQCGIVLSDDDRMRSWVIRQLMCNYRVDYAQFSSSFGSDFREVFTDELENLAAFIDDGFVEIGDDAVTVIGLGEVFVRNIAMVFDAYLKRMSDVRFSKTV